MRPPSCFPVLAAVLLAACASAPPAEPFHPASPAVPADLHVADYRIDATLGVDHRTIDASETIRWTNPSRSPATQLWWHLYMNAFANDQSLFMRTGGRSGHRGHNAGAHGRIEVAAMTLATGENLLATAHYDPDVADDTTQLSTPLPRAVAPGETVEIRVTFRTVLPASFARTGYWRDFAFAGQWFPKLAVLEPDGQWSHFAFHYQTEFYADFGRYDVRLTVPPGDVVGATGVEVEPPSARGNGEMHHFVAADVHDFAWTSWRDFLAIEARIDGIAVRLLYPPGLHETAARDIAALRAGIPFFARSLGPYPYANLTVVVPPLAAEGVEGMEYPTLITTGGIWFAPRNVHDTEYATLHEYAHQYFYGLLASNENAWPFLDEGLTEFATGLAMENAYGSDGALVELCGLRLGYWDYEGAFASLGGHGAIARRADVFHGYEEYGALVYRRTAALLETIRRTRGHAATMRWLRRYADANRFRHPGPEALIAAARDEFGSDFSEGFLRPALFADAQVDYRVVSATPSRAELRRDGVLHFDVDVERSCADGSTARERWPASVEQPPEDRPCATSLRSVRIDPRGVLVMERTRLDDARNVNADASLAALTARVAYWVSAALGMVGP